LTAPASKDLWPGLFLALYIAHLGKKPATVAEVAVAGRRPMTAPLLSPGKDEATAGGQPNP